MKFDCVSRLGILEDDEFQIAIYRNNQQITVAGKNANLMHKEFELTRYLLQNTGKLLSRVHLMEKIGGLGADIDTRTVDAHISRIRNKLNLSSQGDWDIETVYGFSAIAFSKPKQLGRSKINKRSRHFPG